MHNMHKLTTFLVPFLFAVLASTASAAEPQIWKVSAHITDNGATVGEPVVIMNRKKPARMEVSGEAGYTLVLDITGADAETASLAAELTVGGETVTPAVKARYGETATVRIGELQLALTVEPFDGV